MPANGERHGRRGAPTAPGWPGIPRECVVAVRIELAKGRCQVGSGYLVSPNCVLTAWHCTVDKRNPKIPVDSVQVIGRVGSDRVSVVIESAHVTSEPKLDIAVLELNPPWGGGSEWDTPDWARVDRSATGEVADCEAVGFPLWQMDPTDKRRSIAELRGTIRRLEDATPQDNFLVFRDDKLSDVGVPESVLPDDKKSGSVWGGLSGALAVEASASSSSTTPGRGVRRSVYSRSNGWSRPRQPTVVRSQKRSLSPLSTDSPGLSRIPRVLSCKQSTTLSGFLPCWVSCRAGNGR
ncbi:MAG: trypsin-like serine protease [Pseudonocardiaceae bacterium]